jgi:hypothetical protein
MSSSIHYDQLNQKAPYTEIHKCHVRWLGWPIHIKSDLTLSTKEVFHFVESKLSVLMQQYFLAQLE